MSLLADEDSGSSTKIMGASAEVKREYMGVARCLEVEVSALSKAANTGTDMELQLVEKIARLAPGACYIPRLPPSRMVCAATRTQAPTVKIRVGPSSQPRGPPGRHQSSRSVPTY